MKAVIIGGGIIGLSAAYYLRESGWEVMLVDKTDLSDSCSYGNMGMITPSHFVPLAAPGVVAHGIRWMLNNKSPFYIRPSLDRNLISWGWKFIKSATLKHLEYAAGYLLDINLLSKNLYEQMAARRGFNFAMEKKGIIVYYKTPKAREEELRLCEKAVHMGLDVQALQEHGIREIEPDMECNVLGAVHYRCDAHLYPNQLITQLINHLKKSGVIFNTGQPVKNIIREGRMVKKVVTASSEFEADVFVAAAGAWLPQLAQTAGIFLPLMPGKGYSFTLEQPEKKLNVPAILCEARVAITPMNGKMRYGGTMEIGQVNDTINMNRVKGIVESVSRYFPGLAPVMPDKKDIWYGFRPCTPDGLPYIGISKKVDNLIIAGGHAMIGLSLGPATGKIVAELATGRDTSVNIAAFNPDRFS